MNIGFDLDGVFINTPPFIPRWIIDKLYKQKDNGILQYRMPGNLEKNLRRFSHIPLLRAPIKKNLRFLKNLSQNKKYTLFLISSRFSFLSMFTKNIYDIYNFTPIFKHAYFNIEDQQPHIFKEAMIQKEKIEKFVDDDLSLLKYLAKRNPKITFYWYNNHMNKILGENIFAITHLEELLS